MAVILSADDDPDIRRLIERVLSRAGHRVILAPDGRAALDTAFSQDLDLVILDVDMPRMNGLDACRTLRNDRGRRPGVSRGLRAQLSCGHQTSSP